MPPSTDDLRIRSFAPLSTPAELLLELPCTEPMSDNVANARRALHRILHGAGRSARRRDRAVLDPRSEGCARVRAAGCGRCATRTPTRSRSSCACISRSRARPSAGKGSSTTPTSTAASTSTRACGSAAACSATSTRSACRPASSISTRSRRSTSRISSRGARSARARPRARCIASWRRACRAPSGSRTAPTATSRLQ